MAWDLRRCGLLLLSVGALGGLAQAQAPGQTPGVMPRWDFHPPSQTIILPTDPGLKKKFDAIPEYIQEALWPEAVKSLQSLVELREDVFVPMVQQTPGGKEVIQWRSVRAEANRLLGTLPRKALEFYEVAYGRPARDLLKEAQVRNDPHLLAQAAQRYFHTQAGAEATALLGLHHLDRGRYLMAALCFEKHLQRVGIDRLAAPELFRAAMAFHRAGDRPNAETAWKRLAAKAPNGLQLGNRKLTLAELEKALGQPGTLDADHGAVRDWPMFRGTPQREAVARGHAPTAETRWHQALLPDATVEALTLDNWLHDATSRQEARALPVLPGAFPVAVGGRVVARTFGGISCFDNQTGQLLWKSSGDGSLERLLAEPVHASYVGQWVSSHLQHSPSALLENSVLGTLSSNGSLVFAIDDLAVPPIPNHYAGFAGRQDQPLRLAFASDLTQSVYRSRLRALDLGSGKAVWEKGGPSIKDAAEEKGADSPLLDAFLLGPPLPLAGKLYVLVEKKQELRLVCLDAARGEESWTQLLASPQKTLLLDSSRRVHAAHLACADGFLVCPTNAGALIGVDLLTHSLVWAYLYHEAPPPVELPPVGGRRLPIRQPAPPKPPSCDAVWRGAAPIIHQGKVVYAPPDAPGLHCLNLRDGSFRWSFQWPDQGLYVAGVFQNTVLVVGKQEMCALDLDTGKETWKVETGLPSGHGAIAGSVYYLPLKTDPQNRLPSICAIDLVKGTVSARLPVPQGQTPGNLLFHEGNVISQTLTTVTAYPQTPPERGERKPPGD